MMRAEGCAPMAEWRYPVFGRISRKFRAAAARAKAKAVRFAHEGKREKEKGKSEPEVCA